MHKMGQTDEVKICDKCNQPLPNVAKPINHAMAIYVNADGSINGTYNSSTENIVIKGVTLIRQDKWVKPVVVQKTVVPTPTVVQKTIVTPTVVTSAPTSGNNSAPEGTIQTV